MKGENKGAKDKIPLISQVCNDIENGNLNNAKIQASEVWPFDPQITAKRSITPRLLMDLWLRDGFIDRYTGQRLLFPGALHLLSELMPEEFPYHKNWKLDQCHTIYYELYPSHDHIQAAALGGSNDLDNLITCSMLVNAQKGHWTVDQLGWEILSAGRVSEWDGQTAWFLRMVETNPSLLNTHKSIAKWHKIAKTHNY
jgi:hypothetical protein